MEGYA